MAQAFCCAPYKGFVYSRSNKRNSWRLEADIRRVYVGSMDDMSDARALTYLWLGLGEDGPSEIRRLRLRVHQHLCGGKKGTEFIYIQRNTQMNSE